MEAYEAVHIRHILEHGHLGYSSNTILNPFPEANRLPGWNFNIFNRRYLQDLVDGYDRSFGERLEEYPEFDEWGGRLITDPLEVDRLRVAPMNSTDLPSIRWEPKEPEVVRMVPDRCFTCKQPTGTFRPRGSSQSGGASSEQWCDGCKRLTGTGSVGDHRTQEEKINNIGWEGTDWEDIVS